VIRNFSDISDAVPKSMIGINLYFLCQRCMSFQIQNNQVDDIMLKKWRTSSPHFTVFEKHPALKIPIDASWMHSAMLINIKLQAF